MKSIYLALSLLYALPIAASQDVTFQKEVYSSSAVSEAQAAFQYFLDEVELDDALTHEEQHDKVQKFKYLGCR